MNSRHFSLLFLTLFLSLNSLSGLASDGKHVLQNYSSLLYQFNQGESPELQAGRIDHYLSGAKNYLNEFDGDREDQEYQAVSSSVAKLKAFQLLFNRQYQQLPLFTDYPEYQELLKTILTGAINSSPKLIWREDNKPLNRPSTDLSQLSPHLIIMDLLAQGPTLKEKEEELQARLNFIRAMIDDSRIKNQLALWTIDSVLLGQDLECRFVDRQIQERCQVVQNIISRDRSFDSMSSEDLVATILQYRHEAKLALEEEIDEQEFFNPNMGRDALKLAALPSVEKRFPRHMAALNKIKQLKSVQILAAEYTNSKEMNRLTSPMISLYCETKTYPALRNCGYVMAKESVLQFSPSAIERSIERLKKQIATEDLRLNNLAKRIDQLQRLAKKPLQASVSNYEVIQQVKQQQSVTKEINLLILKEIQIRPQAFGAALMDFPQFIPTLSSNLLKVIDSINADQFKENLIAVGVIAALVGTSFITVPVGVATGLAITVYEIIHYNHKYQDYQMKRNATSIEMIEYQYKDLALSAEEFSLLETRFSEMQQKMEYYRRNTYFAAAGLISAPIALGHVVHGSSGKLSSLLENMKFMEKFSAQLAQSERYKKRVERLMHFVGIVHPEQLFSATLKLRRYIQEARSLSEIFLVHRLHHLIKRPEQLHLLERAFAGASYFVKALDNQEMREELFMLMLEIEETPSNYFSE